MRCHSRTRADIRLRLAKGWDSVCHDLRFTLPCGKHFQLDPRVIYIGGKVRFLTGGERLDVG